MLVAYEQVVNGGSQLLTSPMLLLEGLTLLSVAGASVHTRCINALTTSVLKGKPAMATPAASLRQTLPSGCDD
jgi:hypothetical protein